MDVLGSAWETVGWVWGPILWGVPCYMEQHRPEILTFKKRSGSFASKDFFVPDVDCVLTNYIPKIFFHSKDFLSLSNVILATSPAITASGVLSNCRLSHYPLDSKLETYLIHF